MTIRPPVTADSLRKAQWSLVGHLNASDVYSLTYEARSVPEAVLRKGWVKKRGVKQGYAEIEVRGPHGDRVQMFPLTDLEAAAEAITKIRQVAVDDLEWEMTDPRPGREA